MADNFKPLGAKHMKASAEYERAAYFVEVPAGTPMEHILTPEYWRHHAILLKRNDIIEVVSVDDRIDCLLRVLATDVGAARVRLVSMWKPGKDDPKGLSLTEKSLRIEFVDVDGVAWRVMNGKDIVSQGHKTENAAKKAASDYLEKVAA